MQPRNEIFDLALSKDRWSQSHQRTDELGYLGTGIYIDADYEMFLETTHKGAGGSYERR